MTPEKPVIHLKNGTRAIGRSMPPAEGGAAPVYAFLGLPYAEPPVGNLRFEPPKSLPLWEGDRDATEYGAVCTQDLSSLNIFDYMKLKNPSKMSEDCLFLNIWTPTLKAGSKKPVMMFIHGGGFVCGFGNAFYGTGLVSREDVILVTINYRLGLFGFFTTGDEVAPGNYGLLDQIEALHWIQKNIHSFGGDPNNVTIFGESAGSMSVSALLLTPLARGLFRRAIMESGTMKSPGYIRSSRFTVNSLKPILEKLGCTAQKSKDIVQYLRTLDADGIMSKLGLFDRFVPVIDGKVLHADDIARGASNYDAGVDVIIGCNSHEGAMVASFFNKGGPVDLETGKQGITFMVGSAFDPDDSDVQDLIDAVNQEYFVEEEDEQATEKQLVECLGDTTFLVPTVFTALAQAHHRGKTFLYKFNYRMSSSKKASWLRADHSDEMMHVFGWPLFDTTEQIEITTNEDDAAMSRVMMKYWANFAKNGDPNSEGLTEWPRYTPDAQKYLILDDTCSVADHMSAKRVEFWGKALGKYTNLTMITKL